MSKGVKFDEDKLEYDLVDPSFLEDLAKVLTMGAKKYAKDNWKKVPDAATRYEAALFRHFQEYRKGNHIDEESGISHMAHIACNCMFLHYFEKVAKPKKTGEISDTIDEIFRSVGL